MTEYMDGLLQDGEDGFEATDDQSAMWCVRKIAETQKETARFMEHYQEQMRKLQSASEARIAFFQSKLLPYFNRVPHKATKTQESYALPGATLVMKQQGPKYEQDADKLLAFLKASGRDACVKVIPATEKPSWADYKPFTAIVNGALVDKETGEVVDGVTVTEQPPKFEVKIDG